MKTIRGKIILSFVTVFTIVFVMYGYTIFSTSYRFIYRELQKSSEDNLSYVQENINRLLDQFIALSDNVYYNRNIARVMIRNYENNPDANLDRDLQSALADIVSFEGNGIVSQYATCLVLHGVNGQTMRYGNDADYISVEQIQNMKEFATYNDKHNARILSSVDTFSSQTYAKKYLRIIRSAISLDSYRKIGWQYIGISTDLIADTIRDYNFDTTSILFVYDNEGVNDKVTIQEEFRLVDQYAKNYIRTHMSDPIGLTEIADALKVSSSYLSATFSQSESIGLINYINKEKVKRAQYLMASEHLKVYEVSYMLGFENAGYFSKVFKKYAGCTPKQFASRKA